jgi:YidC/Oxa1 family membrane protein insertase
VNPLEFLIDPLRALLDAIHEQGNLTYGWSIVVLTILVRTVMIPLVVRQYTSMRRLQALAPQIKELQEKYKGDRKRLNEEVMTFYRENNVNPAASCLPILVQLPVFFALYYVLRDFSEEAVEGTEPVDSLEFMWVIPDITVELSEIGWGIPIILALYATSQLLVTELSLTPSTPAVQKRLMRLLPIMVVVFVFQFPFPAGLVIYWITTNLWSAGQQLIIKDRLGPAPSVAELTNATGGKGSRTPPRAEAEPSTAALVADAESTEPGAEGAEPVAESAEPAGEGVEAAAGNGAAAKGAKKDGAKGAKKDGSARRQPPRRRGKKRGGKRRAPRKR